MSAPKAPLFHPGSRRLHLLLLVMIGLFNSQYMNTNLAITMTCMVNYTAVAIDQEAFMDPTGSSDSNSSLLIQPSDVVAESSCSANDAQQTTRVLDYGGSLIWDHSIQNWLFSASFWGGVASIIPSIYFVQSLSPKWVFAVCIANKAIVNAMMPFLAINFGFKAVFAVRFILGLSEPFIYPSVNTMVANWFPLEERSTAVAIFTTGNQIAMFVGNPLAASLCSSRWGWPAVFYVAAGLGLIWVVLWCVTSSNSPSECGIMSQRERQFLASKAVMRKSKGKQEETPSVPWRRILTNPAFLSHLFSTYAITVVATLLMTYLPTYFKDVLMLGVLANGTFTSIPMVFNFSFKLSWGLIVDKLKQRRILSLTQAVKLSQCFPTFGVAIPLILVVFFVNCGRPALALVLVCFSSMFMGGHTSGAYTSLLSLAPLYTPTLSSISVSLSMVSQLITPLVVGLLKQKGTIEEWNLVLLFTAAMSIISGIQFLIYGSGDVQAFGKTGQSLSVSKEDETLLREVRVESLRANSMSMI